MRTLCCSAIAFLLLLAPTIEAEDQIPTKATRAIALPGVEGRIDHLAVDLKGERLFVAALGNNTLEVLDLAAGRRIHTISGLHEPQGVAYLPASNLIVVANGGDGSCRVFDGRAYQEKAKIDCKEDADNVRYDAATGRIFVGYGQGAVAAIDLTKQQRIADISLPGHPESFQLETKGKRIFVNVPSARQIAVIDREKKAVVATWPVNEAQANFPMAFDEGNHRLLIACRKPARLLVFDSETGRRVASEACSGDADDLFYDREQKRVYVIGGEGAVSVFQQDGPDRYRLTGTVPTASGARTGLFVPETGHLYVAVPHREGQQGEIRDYRMRPEH